MILEENIVSNHFKKISCQKRLYENTTLSTSRRIISLKRSLPTHFSYVRNDLMLFLSNIHLYLPFLPYNKGCRKSFKAF